jgi:hypothetical protein
MSDSENVGLSSLDYWRLCDELNVIQAALLVAGHDPSSDVQYVEEWDAHERPEGYQAVKAALSRALMSGTLKGILCEQEERDINGNHIGFTDGTIDINRSIVDVAELKIWLSKRGLNSGFFFPEPVAKADFLDPAHPRFSAKLAAAANAWLQMDNGGLIKGKTVKQSLEKWLRLNAPDYGLCDEDGKPNEKGIDECAKVANWQQKGGAPKTPG